MPANPLSGFMLALLGAGKAAETGVQFYDRRKQREQEHGEKEQQIGLQKQELGMEEQRVEQSKSLTDAEISLKKAQADAAEALAGSRKQTSGKGNTKYETMTLGAIRSRLDALTNYQKSGGSLTPEDQAEYEGLSSAFNKKTGVVASPVKAAPTQDQPGVMQGLHDWLYGKKSQQQSPNDPLGLMGQ